MAEESGEDVIRMTIRLDEQSIEAEATKAQERINKALKGKAEPGVRTAADRAKGQKEAKTLGKEIGTAAADTIGSKLGAITGRLFGGRAGGIVAGRVSGFFGAATKAGAGAATAGAGAAAAGGGGAVAGVGAAAAGSAAIPVIGIAIAAVVIAAGVIVIAFKKVADALNNMIKTLARFNPAIFREMRKTELAWTGFRIRFAQAMQPLLVEWGELQRDLIAILVDLMPVFRAMAEATRIIVSGFRMLIQALPNLLRAVGVAAGPFTPVGQAAFGLADLIESGRAGGDTALRIGLEQNRAFLRGLGNVSDLDDARKETRGGPGMVPVAGATTFPTAAFPEIQTNITQRIQMNLQHENAVQEAINQIRQRLLDGLFEVRNMTQINTMMLDGRNLVDML